MGKLHSAAHWLGRRRWLLLGCAVAALGCLLWFWVDSSHPLWDLPGRSADELNAGTATIDIDRAHTLIVRDSLFAYALGVTIIAFALLYATWPSERGRRLQVAAAAAAVLYMYADWAENAALKDVLDDVAGRTVTVDAAVHLARLSNLKWGMLAAAALLLVAAMQRRPPIDPPASSWRSTPSRTPPNADWAPTKGRLGIAVTGGGVRAASFTLGVMQVLHRDHILEKAACVTSVSGGGYTVGAYTALNQTPNGATDAFAPGSPEEQGLRRSLRYITRDPAVLAGALGRVILGVLLNLWLLYILMFAVVRPVGWLIGTPFVHPELRVSEPVAVSIAGFDDDPDTGDAEQPYRTECGLTESPDTTSVSFTKGDPAELSEEPRRIAYEYTVTVPTQCVLVVVPPERETIAVRIPVLQSMPGIVVLEDGRLAVERQPEVKLGTVVPCPIDAASSNPADARSAASDAPDAAASPIDCPVLDGDAPAGGSAIDRTYAMTKLQHLVGDDLVRLTQPTIEVSDRARGIGELTSDSTFVSVDRHTAVAPDSVLDRRGELDIDTCHWLPAVGALVIALLLLLWRVIGRPDYWKELIRLAKGFAGFGAVWGVIMVALPWMVDWAPRLLTSAATSGPSDDLWSKTFDWLPIPRSMFPHLLAWPVLSIASVWNFVKQRKPSDKPPRARSRGARALARKFVSIGTSLAIWVLLVATALSSVVLVISVGALNGPWGRFAFVSTEVLSAAEYGWFPVDLALWFGLAFALVASRGAGEASSWSPAPIYKRRLAWAFAWQRLPNGEASNRAYGPTETWQNMVGGGRHGRVVGTGIGEHPGPEHVLCCAANILGERTAPTGRRSVSFTISPSWIGGPEVGWVDTQTYWNRMGRRRRWDFTLPGAVSISGAAAAPAMGKKEIGPRGSVLAILNVRLGAWVPHPGWVGAMSPGQQWNHNPGWPWFVREVLRRYGKDAPYVYVSDGGHWENLGIVEALRRGCTEVVVISASGDGELSHHAIAEAVEIARTDLGVEIALDGIWRMRPKIGDKPAAELGSGRQYIVEPGPAAELGRASERAFTMGELTFGADGPAPVKGHILVLDATMIDGLPVDVHEYAESRAEFPHVSTGDQLFTDRDFESYRVLGREIATAALATPVTAPLLTSIVPGA